MFIVDSPLLKIKNKLKYKISKTSLKLAKKLPIKHYELKTWPLPELKIENRLKRKESPNEKNNSR